MITMDTASWISFSDLIFDGSRDVCMEITGGEQIRIQSCEIRNFQMSAVIIRGGKDNGIHDCYIHDIGSNVLVLEGGDWESLTGSGFEVNNNHIHSFGYYIPATNAAISLSGVETRITHNTIHDGPHQVINFSGNDHVIMYNEIYDVVQDFFDAGAVNCHTGFNPSWRGTLISSNYFHEVGLKMEGCKCIYTDGASFGVTIEKNIFRNIGTTEVQNNAINNNTGSYIQIRNNMFINCAMPLKNYFFLSQQNTRRFNLYREMWKELFNRYDFSRMPHGEKYPELLQFWAEDRELPNTNTFKNNVIFNTEVELLHGAYVSTQFNKGIPLEELVDISGNVVFTSDPGFIDYPAGDFSLKRGAAVFKVITGFLDVEFSKMGLTGPVGPRSDK